MFPWNSASCFSDGLSSSSFPLSVSLGETFPNQLAQRCPVLQLFPVITPSSFCMWHQTAGLIWLLLLFVFCLSFGIRPRLLSLSTKFCPLPAVWPGSVHGLWVKVSLSTTWDSSKDFVMIKRFCTSEVLRVMQETLSALTKQLSLWFILAMCVCSSMLQIYQGRGFNLFILYWICSI